MVKLSILFDSGIKDFLREVLSTDVSSNCDGVSTLGFDLVHYELGFLLVQADAFKLSVPIIRMRT